jgi:hypothetical protein
MKKAFLMPFNGSEADIDKVNKFIKDKDNVNIYSMPSASKKIVLVIEWVEKKKK